jgi:hypothetical protein
MLRGGRSVPTMVWWLAVRLVALAAYAVSTAAVANNTETSLTLLYQNNLNATDDTNHVGQYESVVIETLASADGLTQARSSLTRIRCRTRPMLVPYSAKLS